MKITIVGAALIIAAAIVVVLVVRVLTSKSLDPAETGSASQSEDTGQRTAKIPEKKNSNESCGGEVNF